MYRSSRKFRFAVFSVFFAFLTFTSLITSFAFAEPSIGWKGTRVRYTGSTWGHPPEPSLITFTRFDEALAWTKTEAATPRLNNTTGISWIVSTDLVERFQTVKDGLITRHFSDNHPYPISQIAPGASLWWGLCSDGWVRGKREARISYLHTIYGPYSEVPPPTKAFAFLNNCTYQSPPEKDFIGVLPLLEVYQVVSEKNLGCKDREKLKGNPCDVTTGNKYHSETDYQSPDGHLSFVRTYNSGLGNDQGLGIAWTSSLTPNLEIFPTTATPGGADYRVLVVREADGRGEPWTKSGSLWVGDSDTQISLIETQSGFTLTRRNGDREFYNGAGLLTSKTSASGQTTTYTRTSTQMLVTGPSGHSLTFSYNGGHISAITDSSGRTISYSYDVNNNLVRVAYPNSTAKIYHYEDPLLPNHLTGISYDSGSGNPIRYARYSYDSAGKAASTEHAGGQEKFAFTYYDGMTHVTDGVGNKEAFSFEMKLGARNLLVKTNLTDNKSLTQSFDASNNLTCKKDEEGRVVAYTYNTANQKVSETVGQAGTCSAPVATPALRTTTYQYLSPTLDLPTVTESPSVYGTSKKRATIVYTNNLPTTITQSGFTPSGVAVSRTVTLSYNTSGQATSIDGPRSDVNDVTTLAYNVCTTGGGCGQLRSVTNALGQTTTYDSYDANGRLLQMTDPNGLRTVYTYDPRGRVETLTQTAPGGVSRVTSYGYDAAGNILSTTLPTGLVLSYTYDAALNLRRVTDSLGNYIDYNYDLKGNRTQTYTYDASGTLVRSVDLAFNARNRVSQLNAGGSITKQVWDAVGNLTSVTDPNTVAKAGSSVTSNSYDSLNRLFQTLDLLSGVTQYGYDSNDRLKTVTAPNGSLTQYQYDDLGNLLKETSPDRGTITYTYDAAGNVVSQTDARGITVAYSYDALNRLTQMDYPGTTEDVTYTYDALSGSSDCALGTGRLCQVTDAGGSSLYSYDGFGSVVLERRTELSVTYNTRYTYDAGNRITSMTYPKGRQVHYTRTPKGDIQATAMTLNGVTTSLLNSISYRPDGLPLTISFGNNLTDTRTYDTQGRLTYQSIGNADTRLYTYDPNGNLTKLQSLPQVGTYSYDVLDRLKQEDRTTQGTITTTWTYDLNGNRKTQNLGTYAYLVNSNRLTSAPGGAITLDAAGNTTSDGTRSYSYNQAGQLAEVNGATYSYNAKRQRSRKVVGSQATVYHYDLSGNLITETDANGNLLRDYVWVGSIPVAQVEAGEQVRYLHGDHLNTPRLATNQQGQKVWSWEGEAFGNTPPNQDPDGNGVNTVINLRFPGQYWDSESGLMYNWNRYYDPKLGRYITSDPIGLEGGHNTYAYVSNNPLKFIDDDGLRQLCPSCEGGGSGSGSSTGGGLGTAIGGIGIGIGIGSGLEKLNCEKPCDPPAGTQCYELNSGHPHKGFDPHYHIWQHNKISPGNCQWNKLRSRKDTYDGNEPPPIGLKPCESYPSWMQRKK